MIPKIIHYCWLSGEEIPKDRKKKIESWKQLLPDYEFMLWDTERFDMSTSVWAQQAFENKKYAFASDLIRFHAVYNYGGIYLDTDVEVLKSFNDLLDLPYFVGAQFDNLIEAAVFGSEKGSSWILRCMQHYNNRSFIKDNGNFDTCELPRVMQARLKGIKDIVILQQSQVKEIKYLIKNEDCLYLFPFEYFSAKSYITGKITETKNTYTIHYFNSSWLPFSAKLRRKFRILVGISTIEKIMAFLRLRKLLDFLYKLEQKWDRIF
ncbi:MAG: glycosyl transferase [Bacteroidia bacterium]|nr:glycosyl transferase [Bacteroidia bacterium]